VMLAPIRDYLSPQDPRSSPLLCTTGDRYFSRLSVDVCPGQPGFEEARWIVLEDVNVEHLLDVFTSFDQTRDDIWDTCSCFIQHLVWHKQRQTILGPKIEALPDDHPSKPTCLSQLSWLFDQMGNHVERKRLITHTLELERQRGDKAQVARTLRDLSDANWYLGLHEEGIRQAKEALEIFERINDTNGQAQSLERLARSLMDDKQFDAAENAASRAINLLSEKDQEFTLCSLHRVLGEIHQSKGEKEKAIHGFKKAIRIASAFNWRGQLFCNHHDLANLFCREGEFDDANTHIEQANLYAVDNTYWQGCTMFLQAKVWFMQHRLEDAQLEALRALEIYEKHGDERSSGYCRNLLQLVEKAMKNQSPSF
jgi:tetratricopeptide (TPR) repeat protein